MRQPLAFTLISLSLAACGGGDDGGSSTVDAGPGKEGFDKPPVTLKANVNMGNETDGPDWVEAGDADLSCMNTPSTLQPTTVDVTLATKVTDFQGGKIVPDATVDVFEEQDYTNPFQTGVAVNPDTGEVQFAIPTGTKRFGYKMSSVDALPTFLFNQKLMSTSQPAQSEEHIQSVSKATAETLPALIGQSRVQGTGVVAGALRDCQGREISGFVATMSSTSAASAPIGGAEAYYFDAAVKLPVNHRRAQYASGDGLFMIIQVPTSPATQYVQMWGYPAGSTVGGDMTLIAELSVPVLGDTVITGSYEPIRSN